ncbi:MAG: hypothetical protein ACTHM6_13235 [Tepidisphaeraceae bacterium]
MIQKLANVALCLSLAGTPVFLGCDRTVAEKSTETTNSDGTKTVDKSKTTESPDGSTQTKTEHEVNK